MKIQLSDHFEYRRLLKFVMPSVIMLVFTSVYVVVDGLFISNFVGDTAFAAINLIYPVINVLGGFGFMLGTGGSALVAKTIGEQDKPLANRYFSMMIMVSVILGLVLSIAGVIFIKPISVMLGATNEMLPHCVKYGRLLIAFIVTFMLQYAFQAFLITAEKPKLGLIATVAAGVTNMLLDALFVALFKWGVAGAALATGLSQLVGTLIPLIYFMRPNTSLLRLTASRIEAKPVLKACANGSSEMVTNMTSAFIGILYNFQLLKYAGENGVSAYGVVMYVQFIFVAVYIGYSMGSAPVISYHYGAANRNELKNLFSKSMVIMGTLGLIMITLAQLLAVSLSKIFVGYNKFLFDMTVRALRISTVSFAVLGFNIFTSSFFTALNDGGVSAAVSFMRTFIFKLAAVLILPAIFKLDGIWFAEVTAEVSAFAVSMVFIFAKKKKYGYM